MSRKSFTIIEILVIISVLSILIGLAIPRVKGMMDSANIAKIKGELQTLQAAIESYYTFKHTIPGTPISFMSVDTALVATWLSTTSPLVISTPLVDPYGVASAEYVYSYDTTHNYYIIASVGLNSVSGCSSPIKCYSNSVFCTALTSSAIYVTNIPSNSSEIQTDGNCNCPAPRSVLLGC